MRGEHQILLTGAQRYRGFDQFGETTQRIGGTAGSSDRRCQVFGDALIECGPDQVGFRRKPAVEGSLADAGTARDSLDRRIGPQLAIHVPRRAQNALDVAGRVRSQPTVFHRCHSQQPN
ncbi:Uncharacterised protein [Mycobacterium tuberculosis]|nr:Uncharacterised protein [Mycobacterium tuberculosis]